MCSHYHVKKNLAAFQNRNISKELDSISETLPVVSWINVTGEHHYIVVLPGTKRCYILKNLKVRKIILYKVRKLTNLLRFENYISLSDIHLFPETDSLGDVKIWFSVMNNVRSQKHKSSQHV